jgi:hypothetical protein
MTIEIKLANGMEGSFENGVNADEWFQRSRTIGQDKAKLKAKKKKPKVSKKAGRYHIKPQKEVVVRGSKSNTIITDEEVVTGELCIDGTNTAAYVMDENDEG